MGFTVKNRQFAFSILALTILFDGLFIQNTKAQIVQNDRRFDVPSSYLKMPKSMLRASKENADLRTKTYADLEKEAIEQNPIYYNPAKHSDAEYTETVGKKYRFNVDESKTRQKEYRDTSIVILKRPESKNKFNTTSDVVVLHDNNGNKIYSDNDIINQERNDYKNNEKLSLFDNIKLNGQGDDLKASSPKDTGRIVKDPTLVEKQEKRIFVSPTVSKQTKEININKDEKVIDKEELPTPIIPSEKDTEIKIVNKNTKKEDENDKVINDISLSDDKNKDNTKPIDLTKDQKSVLNVNDTKTSNIQPPKTDLKKEVEEKRIELESNKKEIKQNIENKAFNITIDKKTDNNDDTQDKNRKPKIEVKSIKKLFKKDKTPVKTNEVDKEIDDSLSLLIEKDQTNPLVGILYAPNIPVSTSTNSVVASQPIAQNKIESKKEDIKQNTEKQTENIDTKIVNEAVDNIQTELDKVKARAKKAVEESAKLVGEVNNELDKKSIGEGDKLKVYTTKFSSDTEEEVKDANKIIDLANKYKGKKTVLSINSYYKSDKEKEDKLRLTAFNRALAIKKILTDNGVSADNIITVVNSATIDEDNNTVNIYSVE